MTPHWTDELRAMGACPAAVKWARGYPSLQAAWDACERGDWMMWMIGHTPGLDLRRVGWLCYALASQSQYLVPPEERRPADCLALVARWCHGDTTITEDDLRRAAEAVWAARAAGAARAAEAAAGAVWAAEVAAGTARAAWAAGAAWVVGVVGATGAPWAEANVRIIREHLPWVALPSERPR